MGKADEITMRCPKCRKTVRVGREPHDPPRATFCSLLCEDCVDGGFDDVHYYDDDENEIDGDPSSFTKGGSDE
jgi:endogenous inhibitor of DNA gyrase (YacG/DUF329 family)